MSASPEKKFLYSKWLISFLPESSAARKNMIFMILYNSNFVLFLFGNALSILGLVLVCYNFVNIHKENKDKMTPKRRKIYFKILIVYTIFQTIILLLLFRAMMKNKDIYGAEMLSLYIIAPIFIKLSCIAMGLVSLILYKSSNEKRLLLYNIPAIVESLFIPVVSIIYYIYAPISFMLGLRKKSARENIVTKIDERMTHVPPFNLKEGYKEAKKWIDDNPMCSFLHDKTKEFYIDNKKILINTIEKDKSITPKIKKWIYNILEFDYKPISTIESD